MDEFFSRSGAIRRFPEDRSSPGSIRDAGSVRGPLRKDFIERFEGEPEGCAARDVVRPDVVVDGKDSRRERSAVRRNGKLGVIATLCRDPLDLSFAIDENKKSTGFAVRVRVVHDSPV